MRQVDRIIAVAPGVERIAVARDAADHPLGLGALVRREWREVQAGNACAVEDHLGQATRTGDDRDAAATWPALALADRQHFGHLVEIVDLNGAMRPQEL